MNQTNALRTLGHHNVFLDSMTARQLESYLDGSSDSTLQAVLDASRVVNHHKARRLAVECEAELRRRSFSRKH